jgi:hypothetical protein
LTISLGNAVFVHTSAHYSKVLALNFGRQLGDLDESEFETKKREMPLKKPIEQITIDRHGSEDLREDFEKLIGRVLVKVPREAMEGVSVVQMKDAVTGGKKFEVKKAGYCCGSDGVAEKIGFVAQKKDVDISSKGSWKRFKIRQIDA